MSPTPRPQRVTENDSYVNSVVTEILCRALSDDEWPLARDVWLTWYPKNRGGWFHWSRAFGGFLHLWRAHRSKVLAESGFSENVVRVSHTPTPEPPQ